MPDDTYRGLLENISETSGTYNQMLKAIAEGGGAGGGVLVANVDTQTFTLDKTWAEIDEAPFTVAKIKEGKNNLSLPVLSTIRSSAKRFIVTCLYPEEQSGVMQFVATSADGYPVYQQG